MPQKERKHVCYVQKQSANVRKQEKLRQSCTYHSCYHGPMNTVVTMAGSGYEVDFRGQALFLISTQTEGLDPVCWFVYFGQANFTRQEPRRSVQSEFISCLQISLSIPCLAVISDHTDMEKVLSFGTPRSDSLCLTFFPNKVQSGIEQVRLMVLSAFYNTICVSTFFEEN